MILDEEQVESFNQKIRAAGLDVTDMKRLPSSVPVKEFLPWITNTWAMRGTVYRNGREVTEAEKEAIQNNLNLAALPSENEAADVRYGVTVRHALIRNLPLADGLFESTGRCVLRQRAGLCAGSGGTGGNTAPVPG